MSLAASGARIVAPFEALDARTRLVAALSLVLVTVSMRSLSGQVAALLLALVMLRLSGLSLAQTSRRLLHVEGFMIALLVLLPLTVPGPALLSFGPFSMSQPGVARAVSIILSVNAAVLSTLSLLHTLEPVRLGRALASLGLPSRLVHLMMFLVRYQSLLRDEATRLVEAMRARGFAGRLRMHTWRTYGNLVGMLLVRSVERAERVDEAMRCRGFSGRFPMRANRPLTRADWRFGCALAAVLAALVGLDRFS
ncbi:MAG: hypothetical protein JWL93_562 [Hyphomicrobiales bacterium]|nr:hypothetical protein [Hyphomicrobiales bacterium]